MNYLRKSIHYAPHRLVFFSPLHFIIISLHILAETKVLFAFLHISAANIKIKIITNEGPLSSMPSNGKTEFLTDETATQFKDILANMLVCMSHHVMPSYKSLVVL